MVWVVKRVMVASLLVSSLLFGMGVDEINSASKEELMKIKGIGEHKADAIIEQRAVKPFESMDEVESVKGIGVVLHTNLENNIYKKEFTTIPTATK